MFFANVQENIFKNAYFYYSALKNEEQIKFNVRFFNLLQNKSIQHVICSVKFFAFSYERCKRKKIKK